MNLRELNVRALADEKKPLTLRHPITNKELDVKIFFYGIYSSAHEEAKKKMAELYAEGNLQKEDYEKFVLSCLACDNENLEFYEGDKKEFDNSQESFFEVFNTLSWVYDQAREFIFNTDTFFLEIMNKEK